MTLDQRKMSLMLQKAVNLRLGNLFKIKQRGTNSSIKTKKLEYKLIEGEVLLMSKKEKICKD